MRRRNITKTTSGRHNNNSALKNKSSSGLTGSTEDFMNIFLVIFAYNENGECMFSTHCCVRFNIFLK